MQNVFFLEAFKSGKVCYLYKNLTLYFNLKEI